jgi:hypothetical protein
LAAQNEASHNKRKIMGEKLGIGAAVPSLTLTLVGGGTAKVPDLTDAKYQLVLFYRGHW